MNNGKLIVLDSFTDCCGKETQTKKLYERLKEEGYKVRRVSFPDYDSWHSIFVRKYLAGDFGDKASDVNSKAASTFYAIDRYASYMEKWREEYSNGTIILCDRYVSSNQIYQGAKLSNFEERISLAGWLYELEHKIYGIPVPSMVLCLDLKPEIAIETMKTRLNKIDNSDTKDIHESDTSFMLECYKSGKELAEVYNWTTIKCDDGEVFRDLDSIHEDIYLEVKQMLDGRWA